MKAVLAILPLLVLGLAGAWEIRDYEQFHKPKADEMYAEMLYDKCIRGCMDVCQKTCEMMETAEADCQCVPLCKKECFHYLEEE